MTDKQNKVWNFKQQLKVGDRGEEIFLERYPRKIKLYPGREYDFTVQSSREKLELKTDSYNIEKTDNFFMERWSCMDRKKPGGPWRAAKDEVDIFCYYFVRNNIWFEFRDLPALVERLDEVTKKKGLVFIKNKGWITGGFKLRRELFDDLYTVWEFDPS